MSNTQQMSILPPDDPASFITMHNALCFGAWDISPMAHDVLLLVGEKYKHRHEIQQGTETNPKLEYIDLKISEIVGYGASKTDYIHARNLLHELRAAGITMAHDLKPGELELEGIAIFYGRMWYSEKKDSLRIALNKDLKEFFEEQGANYTKLFITEMLSLPKTMYPKLAYQFFKSLEYKRQFEISIEALLRVFGCTEKYPKWNDFNKRVLAPSVKDINECTSLHFKYEPQHGIYNRVTSVRFWYQSPENLFPPEAVTQPKQEKPKTLTQTKETDIAGAHTEVRFKDFRQGTTVTRKDVLTVKIDGFIGDCGYYVKELGGTWEGPRGNKDLKFNNKDLTEQFLKTCEASGIKVFWN